MEFSYDKILLLKYALFGGFWILVIIGAVVASPVFQIIAIIVAVVAGLASLGAIRKVFELIRKIYIVERQGVHFYEGSNQKFYLPWSSVDDFSVSRTQCILRVKKQFFRISSELKDFEDFKNLISEQLSMPPEFRGLNLPRLDKPTGIGGRPDTSDIRTDHIEKLMNERARAMDPTISSEPLESLTDPDSSLETFSNLEDMGKKDTDNEEGGQPYQYTG